MQIKWSIENRDAAAVQELLNYTKDKNFVRGRIQRNVSGHVPRFSRDGCWRTMVSCLMTSHQRAGPDSPVSRFLRMKPFPLRLEVLSDRPSPSLIAHQLSTGGIWRARPIADQAVANLRWLDSAGWGQIQSEFRALMKQRGRTPRDSDAERERQAAQFIAEHLKGFGPKQSRNFWQGLGLTRYEIPLDSRIIDWANESAILPFRLSAQPLADRSYYEFVMDALQGLCRAIGVLPCVLDAAVFARKDRDWRPDEINN